MGSIEIAVTAALIPGIACIALYIVDIQTIYRQRKRKTIELNSAASIPAFIALGLSILLAIALFWTGATDAMIAALVYLFTFGWLTGLSLAQLYKIVPFLTWLECYGPVMGVHRHHVCRIWSANAAHDSGSLFIILALQSRRWL